jgi:uncharacterized protein YgiB involved in biofilm formation
MKTRLPFLFVTAIAFFMLQSAGCNNVKELEYKGVKKNQTTNLKPQQCPAASRT